MIIIIKNKNKPLKIKNKNILIIENLCNLNKLKERKNILILLDLKIVDGIVIDYNFFLEELFISIPIMTVISNFKNNKIREMCTFYQIPLIEV